MSLMKLQLTGRTHCELFNNQKPLNNNVGFLMWRFLSHVGNKVTYCTSPWHGGHLQGISFHLRRNMCQTFPWRWWWSTGQLLLRSAAVSVYTARGLENRNLSLILCGSVCTTLMTASLCSDQAAGHCLSSSWPQIHIVTDAENFRKLIFIHNYSYIWFTLRVFIIIFTAPAHLLQLYKQSQVRSVLKHPENTVTIETYTDTVKTYRSNKTKDRERR